MIFFAQILAQMKKKHYLCSQILGLMTNKLQTERILLRPWQESDAEVRFLRRIGLIIYCSRLMLGSDQPVKIMKLTKTDYSACEH